jgi:hypothetical protein
LWLASDVLKFPGYFLEFSLNIQSEIIGY